MYSHPAKSHEISNKAESVKITKYPERYQKQITPTTCFLCSFSVPVYKFSIHACAFMLPTKHSVTWNLYKIQHFATENGERALAPRLLHSF